MIVKLYLTYIHRIINYIVAQFHHDILYSSILLLLGISEYQNGSAYSQKNTNINLL